MVTTTDSANITPNVEGVKDMKSLSPQEEELTEELGGLNGMGGPNFSDAGSIFDLFGDIFGDFFGQRGGRSGATGGRDLQISLEIDLIEAARGTRKSLTIPREENCSDCNE